MLFMMAGPMLKYLATFTVEVHAARNLELEDGETYDSDKDEEWLPPKLPKNGNASFTDPIILKQALL